MTTTRTRIRAAVLVQPGAPLKIRQLDIDEPLPGEVRVRTIAAGLCHSDLHYLNGTLPIELPAVLGHEVVGEIVAVGEARSSHRIGERVVVTITPSCGLCTKCVAGLATQCERSGEMRVRSRPKLTDEAGAAVNLLGSIGAFAEQLIVPESAAVPVDLAIPASEACLLGCCVATGFGAVVHAAEVSPLDSVAVIGCGGVGVAAIQAARIAGARAIIAIDVHREKLDRALTFGATHALVSTENLVEDLHRICPGGVDKSFEAVGSPHTAAQAFDILASSGTATILGLEKSGSRISIDAERLIEGDRKLRGAYMGMNQLPRDMLAFNAHHRSGELQLDRMVTSRWCFEEINEGFAAMQQPDAIRSVIEW
jgi:alcohol dehydrogenase/S-(hydroxymethyl)glutathione dehydrogenase/alcohol dehydrogenase